MAKKSKKIKIFKVILFAMVVIIGIVGIIYLFPIMKNISTPQGQEVFRNKITNSGILGGLMLFSLELAQIFLVILPGEPLEVLAGMCYGTICGTIFIMVSVFITTTIIFYLVRKFGKKVLYEFCSKEKIDKIEKSKIFNNSKTIEFIMFLLFLIPGTPKDLLVYIGGILPIKPLRFIFISTFARFPSIISSTLAGSYIIKGNFKFTFIIYLITFISVFVILIFVNIFDKNKETKKAIDMIK